MTIKKLLKKFSSTYVWGHVVAVAIVVVLLAIGVRYGLASYTRHGESIVIPNVVHMQYAAAKAKLDSLGIALVVNDTAYFKNLPPDCIIEQAPVMGKRVKPGHTIYITINSAGSPTLVIPDVIDNGSWREVQARMMSLGFKLGEPQYIPGEREWIYGITVNGRPIKTGDRVSADAKLIFQVGDGTRSATDSIRSEFSQDDFQYEEVEVEEPIYEDVYEEIEVPADEEEGGAPAEKPAAS